MNAATSPHPADIAAVLVLADVLHEVRRAVRRPSFQIHSGAIASCQSAALTFGWLSPDPDEPRLLRPTDPGRRAIADAGAAEAKAERLTALPIHSPVARRAGGARS
jgi:hypothetical protein